MKLAILLINLFLLTFSLSYFLFEIEFLGIKSGVYYTHFLLGAFQMILSIIYVFQRKKTNIILDLHLGLAGLCLILLYVSTFEGINMSENLFFGVFPSFTAVVFTYGAWLFGSKRKLPQVIK